MKYTLTPLLLLKTAVIVVVLLVGMQASISSIQAGCATTASRCDNGRMKVYCTQDGGNCSTCECDSPSVECKDGKCDCNCKGDGGGGCTVTNDGAPFCEPPSGGELCSGFGTLVQKKTCGKPPDRTPNSPSCPYPVVAVSKPVISLNDCIDGSSSPKTLKIDWNSPTKPFPPAQVVNISSLQYPQVWDGTQGAFWNKLLTADDIINQRTFAPEGFIGQAKVANTDLQIYSFDPQWGPFFGFYGYYSYIWNGCVPSEIGHIDTGLKQCVAPTGNVTWECVDPIRERSSRSQPLTKRFIVTEIRDTPDNPLAVVMLSVWFNDPQIKELLIERAGLPVWQSGEWNGYIVYATAKEGLDPGLYGSLSASYDLGTTTTALITGKNIDGSIRKDLSIGNLLTLLIHQNKPTVRVKVEARAYRSALGPDGFQADVSTYRVVNTLYDEVVSFAADECAAGPLPPADPPNLELLCIQDYCSATDFSHAQFNLGLESVSYPNVTLPSTITNFNISFGWGDSFTETEKTAIKEFLGTPTWEAVDENGKLLLLYTLVRHTGALLPDIPLLLPLSASQPFISGNNKTLNEFVVFLQQNNMNKDLYLYSEVTSNGIKYENLDGMAIPSTAQGLCSMCTTEPQCTWITLQKPIVPAQTWTFATDEQGAYEPITLNWSQPTDDITDTFTVYIFGELENNDGEYQVIGSLIQKTITKDDTQTDFSLTLTSDEVASIYDRLRQENLDDVPVYVFAGSTQDCITENNETGSITSVPNVVCPPEDPACCDPEVEECDPPVNAQVEVTASLTYSSSDSAACDASTNFPGGTALTATASFAKQTASLTTNDSTTVTVAASDITDTGSLDDFSSFDYLCHTSCQTTSAGSSQSCRTNKSDTNAYNFVVTDIYSAFISWWQAVGGLVYADTVSSAVPYNPSLCPTENSSCTPYLVRSPDWIENHRGGVVLGEAVTPQVRFVLSERPDEDYAPDILKTNFQKNTLPLLNDSMYDYFINQLESQGTPFTKKDGNQAWTEYDFSQTGEQYFVIEGNLTILPTATINIPAGTTYTLLVNGNVRIGTAATFSPTAGNTQPIAVANGGLLLLVAKNDITVTQDVGQVLDFNIDYNQYADAFGTSAAVSSLDGLYLSDQKIIIEGGEAGAPTSDKRFMGSGSFVAKETVVLNRSFHKDGMSEVEVQRARVAYGYTPTEIFFHRPDMVLQIPQVFKSSIQLYEEVQ